MPRPKSDVKRSAILEAATRVIVTQGLSAPTAAISKAAEIPNGSLFTYFATKAELFDQLYLELKREQAMAAMEGLRRDAELSAQLFQVWENWMWWGRSFPEKRRAMEQLDASVEITSETRSAAHAAMAGVADLVDRVRAKGHLRKAPLRFVVGIVNSTAETTMEFMDLDPWNAKNYCRAGFDAVWRVLN